MNVSIPASVRLADAPVARIGGAGGYRLDGDKVVLNADLEWLDPGAAARPDDWALQLWAWPADAAGAAEATKIAELPLAAAADAAAPIRVEAVADALPPAGRQAYTVVLALSAGQAGVYDTVHDLLVFPRPEEFTQPRFQGPVGYAFDGGRVRLQAEQVLNPRAADNLSGDLSLELWALAAPYGGGAFAGFRIGATTLGRLAGQSDWRDVQASAEAAALPAGRWSLTLMLREWAGAAGWVTRDYANFDLPHVVEAAEPAERVAEVPAPTASLAAGLPVAATEPAAVEPEAAPATPQDAAPVRAEAAATAPVATELAPQAAWPFPTRAAADADVATRAAAEAVVPAAPKRAAKAGSKSADKAADAPTAPASAKGSAKTANKAADKAAGKAAAGKTPAKASDKAPAKAPAKLAEPAAAASGRVSVNHAAEAELAAVKGLSKPLAKAIVAGRPYRTLDALVAVKGLGEKLLAKLRPFLEL